VKYPEGKYPKEKEAMNHGYSCGYVSREDSDEQVNGMG
jgi:hypothetical protein